MPSRTTILASLGVLLMTAAAGCASNPGPSDDSEAARHCPAGHTMTCEADRIGRIFHGTFRNDVEKCACVPDGGRTLDSPVIPSVHR